MTWFKVDDSFHSHRKVLAASPAALGLWVVAGSWSGANLSDGFIPDHVLPRLLPDSVSLAKELVTCRLWRRAKGGYQFHDWIEYNPSRSEAVVAAEKKSSGGTLGNHRRWHVGKGVIRADCAFCQRKQDRTTDRSPIADPNRYEIPRPDPTRPDLKGGPSTSVTNDRAHEEPPSNRCEEHLNADSPPRCGACADARRSRDQWEAERRRRIAAAPTCRRHRGQPAHNCAPCRSEQLAGGHTA